MDIQFFGAADSVTGSRHLVTVGDKRVLLDCGLFQGFKVHRERNWQPLPFDHKTLDAVVLSHAHLDHSGYLPRLVKFGYRGPIYASPATCDLAEVLLLDSAYLQEEDARRANRYGYSRHAKALPLYTKTDARRALAQFVPLVPGRKLSLGTVDLMLHPVGHLLGACAVTLTCAGETLAFSGDLGRDDDLLMPPPQTLKRADVLLVESTYGNRCHTTQDMDLGALIRETIGRGGSVLMPSFAVGRAQALMLLLQRLRAAGEIPTNLPIFLDSPMAIEATALYLKHGKLLRIPASERRTLTDGVTMTPKPAQSMRITQQHVPSVIISASGMATGGRVLHHLKAMAPDARNHIVFPGFQVGGTRGAHLIAGATEVKIHGAMVPVRAKVSHLSGMSGHADADALMAWMRAIASPPHNCFVVHGEPDAADTLRQRIKDELKWRVCVPEHGQRVST